MEDVFIRTWQNHNITVSVEIGHANWATSPAVEYLLLCRMYRLRQLNLPPSLLLVNHDTHHHNRYECQQGTQRQHDQQYYCLGILYEPVDDGCDHQQFLEPCGPALCQADNHTNWADEHGEFHQFVNLESAEHLGFHRHFDLVLREGQLGLFHDLIKPLFDCDLVFRKKHALTCVFVKGLISRGLLS